jgi:hypothetical protein
MAPAQNDAPVDQLTLTQSVIWGTCVMARVHCTRSGSFSCKVRGSHARAVQMMAKNNRAVCVVILSGCVVTSRQEKTFIHQTKKKKV